MHHVINTSIQTSRLEQFQSEKTSDEAVVEALEDYFRRNALSCAQTLPRWMP